MIPIIIAGHDGRRAAGTRAEVPPARGKQSLAHLVGDSVALPLALWAAAMSWRVIGQENGFHQRWWWLLVAITAGVLITLRVAHFPRCPALCGDGCN